MELADVAARAAGENFPVGSILFPRALRPHVRALYCYARLVDELGDAYDGDRLAALDELEEQVGLTFEGEPSWPVLRNVQPTVREFDLPREPFLRLIEANRMDQRVTEYETWDDLEIALAIEVGGRAHEDALHLFGLTDVLAANGEERGDRARHVGRGHAGAAVLDVQRIALCCRPRGIERRAGAARDDLLAGRDEVGLGPAVTRRTFGPEI